MTVSDVVFGFGAPSSVHGLPELIGLAEQADRDGLDLLSLSDHPYLGHHLDAYASVAYLLGRTRRLRALVNVTNLPTRPAPMLARTVTSLTSLTGDRLVLGAGAGGDWDRITDLGVPRLSPGEAVVAFEEAITLIGLLSGGGDPVTFHGRHYRVDDLAPAPAPPAPVWTGSVGPKSLAVTGRVADGWIPGRASDWLSARYRESRPLIDEAAVESGRSPGEIRTIFNFSGRITDHPLPATRDRDGRWVGGSVDQWVEELTGAVLQHDAAGFVLFAADFGSHDSRALGRWGAEIAPAVRAAIGQSSTAASAV